MLKKLVKYGNSNALILDRAIMELLNIQEGSVVKLQTDGKSLIISPAQAEKPVNITLNGLETLTNIGAGNWKPSRQIQRKNVYLRNGHQALKTFRISWKSWLP